MLSKLGINSSFSAISQNSSGKQVNPLNNQLKSKDLGDTFISSSKSKNPQTISFGKSVKTLFEKAMSYAKGSLTKATNMYDQGLQANDSKKIFKGLGGMKKALEKLEPGIARKGGPSPDKYAELASDIAKRHVDTANTVNRPEVQKELLTTAQGLYAKAGGVLQGDLIGKKHKMENISYNLQNIGNALNPSAAAQKTVQEKAAQTPGSSHYSDTNSGFLASLFRK